MPTVSGLTVHPVKACRGCRVEAALVTSTGLAFDRHWMLVSEEKGNLVCQRHFASLALVEVTLPATAFTEGIKGVGEEACMLLNAPGMSELQVPIHNTGGSLRQCRQWERTALARDTGDAAAAWFSAYIGLPVRLVAYAGHDSETPECTWPTDEWAPGSQTAFADDFGVLVASQESLEELNSRVSDGPLKMNRFRANIEVTGCHPFEEDDWEEYAITPADPAGTSIPFTRARLRDRCKVTTIEQETAEYKSEPIDTLHSFRSGRQLELASQVRAWKHAVFFGALGAPRGSGVICVGSTIEVQRACKFTGQPPSTLQAEALQPRLGAVKEASGGQLGKGVPGSRLRSDIWAVVGGILAGILAVVAWRLWGAGIVRTLV